MQSPPKNFDRILEVAEQILQIFRESDEKTWSEKYETLWLQKLDELASLVFCNKELRDYLSRDDLYDRLFHIVMYLGKDLKDVTAEDLRSYLGRLLGTPDTHEFFFPALELFNFPDGYVLGLCELHSFPKLPQQVQTQISSEWKLTYESEKNIYLVRSFDEYQERKRRETYFCLSVQALGNSKAIEKATRLANQGLNILKCFYPLENAPKLVACYYNVGASHGAVREERFIWGWHNHWTDKEIEGYLRIVNDFVRKGADDEIARRCLSAIDIYGMMERQTPTELKFLLSVIATERLLLGKDDKDFLGWKLREKAAMLLGDTPGWLKKHLDKSPKDTLTEQECNESRAGARAGLAKEIGAMYEKRSGLVHQDKEEITVTEEDFDFASMVFRWSLHRILRLYSEKGIRRISKKSTVDLESLDGFIESMKYSAPLGW
jgi:hypothetical protein